MSASALQAPSELIRVCAHCHPGRSALFAYPWLLLSHAEISHGICKHHKAEQLAEIAKLKSRRETACA